MELVAKGNTVFERKTFFKHWRTALYLALSILIIYSLIILKGEPTIVELEHLQVNVINNYPHDAASFTQGLVYRDGRMFESAGLYGKSSLREVVLSTGSVIKMQNLSSNYFAEGLELVDNKLIQLTWREGKAFVYERDSFDLLDQFSYSGEGWGLCYDGLRLIMSDGSDKLYFRSPENFEIIGEIKVTLEGQELKNLNELEFVDGYVYANVWQQDIIVKINPATGIVVAVIDASGLLTSQESVGADVLNGIAWKSETKTFLITGKKWPKLFEVTFVKK